MPEKKNVKTKNEDISSENKQKKTNSKNASSKTNESSIIDELQKQNKILQEQMNALLAGVSMGKNSNSTTIANNKVYQVITHMLNGVSISNINKDIVIFIPYDTVMEITYDDMFQIMKNSSSKSLFVMGCVEFTIDESYQDFNINKFQKIEYEDIEDLFKNKSRNEIISQLDIWTNELKNNNLTHMVFNMIVSLSADFKLDLVSSKSGIVNDYFKFNLEDGVNNLRTFRQFMKK